MRPGKAAALAALVALAGCGGVKVTPTGAAAERKPPDCSIDFLAKAPDREYDEIAELEAHVTSVSPGGPESEATPVGPRGPLEVLRKKACELGADALIVTRNFVTNAIGHVLVAGTAIKYRPAPERPAPEPQLPPGETVDL